ncbi:MULTISPECIES: oligopeptide transporter, OPT family [Metallibacterium]|jgi:putative OPT family oligopeptide transporter|uniref:OPT family oligopeptide transporter n=1 Tax=Metallibacterium TaxID=1218803 RepID=UPI00261DC393|nr:MULTISPECIES: oligopeptide transporter, OPT family [Metallibacterium]MBW8074978.1 oligopeptide transporter, OPT family [Metallibacterium scheffleri]
MNRPGSNHNSSSTRELTLRGVILGIVITLVFTAANVYFGLKAGLTFATSIPAAVISMALLKGMGGSSMQENNIVQTLASAAGTLSAIIFVLPGLVMVGWWQGFPFWMSFGVCALGGILGVMYSIPLRRALVTGSDLPYPEGVACAEVLKVGSTAAAGSSAARENRAGLLAVTASALVSAGFAVIVATRVFAGNVAAYFRFGDRGATGADFSLSFALFAVGHLVGLWVGLSMLLGALIGWAGLVPVFTWLHPAAGSASDVAQGMWATRVRFVGAGAIGVAAIWTLAKLVQPVVSGLRGAMAAARVRKAGKADTLPRTEQDLPIGLVGLITLISLLPIAWMLLHFGLAAGLRAQITLLLLGALVFIVLMSFFVSAVCGYMAGLIGSSNSPLSGVGILVVIAAALLLVLGVAGQLPAGMQPALVAYALFVTAVVFAVATIANNNLQDLKTGQLVDATPWKQQVALVIGVIAGAAVIPPVLDLLLKAYGFAGMPGSNPAQALAAPQAALISALAQGVIEHKLDWSMIGLGAAIGVVIVILDELLGRRGKSARLPPLAVGLGIYLPTSTTLMVVIGAVAGWFFERRAEHTAKPDATKQLGVLLASGMIVGESLIGVALAALVVFSGKDAPLALVGPGFAGAAVVIGALAFALVMYAMYAWLLRLAHRAA